MRIYDERTGKGQIAFASVVRTERGAKETRGHRQATSAEELMVWIILILLAYTLVGALLVARHMRGLQVRASLLEWATFVLLWPLMIRFFLQLAVLQARINQVEDWTDPVDENR